jgi:hypothetical protein
VYVCGKGANRQKIAGISVATVSLGRSFTP